MLHDFLIANRSELVADCRRRVASRSAPTANASELEHGVPIFLDQLIDTLGRAAGDPTGLGDRWSVVNRPAEHAIAEQATRHGAELFRHKFTIDQVVHDYGDLCQAIMELAMERKTPVALDEFRVLNQSLDDAIAQAVSAYSAGRASLLADDGRRAENERLGEFAHELRNLLHTATLALSAMRTGQVGLNGATGAVLDRSLIALQNLIDRSLAEVRNRAGLGAQRRTFALNDFIADARVSATLEARTTGCAFSTSDVDPRLALHADRDLLMAAVGNLLQNAFKFSQAPGEVALNAYASGERILIEVSDTCGGLPDGDDQILFHAFHQASANRSGLGLGLSIAQRSVEANDGTLSARDRAPVGCVFTIDLPRHAMPK